MRTLNIAISVVVFAAGVVRAQETPSPSPSPLPKASVPKLRGPVLPTTGSPRTGPIVPTTADAPPKRTLVVPPVTTSARPALPALPALPVRLPGAARPDQSGPGLPRLSLGAISTINGTPVAVINDRRVAAGDVVAGARVIRILEDRVELEYQGRRFAIGF